MGKKLPVFETDEDLTKWFDKTSLSDYDLEAVEENSNELVPLTIRLNKSDIEKLKHAAKKAGIGHTTLVRMIIRRELGSTRK
mgnify:CR=1 FL=1